MGNKTVERMYVPELLIGPRSPDWLKTVDLHIRGQGGNGYPCMMRVPPNLLKFLESGKCAQRSTIRTVGRIMCCRDHDKAFDPDQQELPSPADIRADRNRGDQGFPSIFSPGEDDTGPARMGILNVMVLIKEMQDGHPNVVDVMG